jgi:hypothetical protein
MPPRISLRSIRATLAAIEAARARALIANRYPVKIIITPL